MDCKAVARDLESWFAANQRDLPWRRDPTPYNILLSEFILQQTRMEVGLRYYESLRKRFPTLQALARARESSVLAAWSGLGYYSRARNLHRTAREIQRRFAGTIPDDPNLLQTLPGIGPYTAGAIASIAYDRPAPSVDGNQQRVLTRLTGDHRMKTAAERRALHETATRLLQAGSPRALNQALMDLGSRVCTPEAPRCGECPIRTHCVTKGAGPRTSTTAKTQTEHWQASLHVRGDKVWLLAPRGNGLLGTGWLPPLKKAAAARRYDLEHVFSHRRWRIRTLRPDARPRGAGRWVALQDLARLPHSSLTERLMKIAVRKPT